MRTSDLFQPMPPAAHKPAPQTAATASRFDLPCRAAKSIAQQVGGTLVGWWPYSHADGGEALLILRFDLPDVDPKTGKPGKTFRPIRRNGEGWAIGDPPGPLPLYRLAALGGPACVYVVEGEKCADAAAGVGLAATTSAHGAKSAAKTNWTPLAGREVAILPDNDANGEAYAVDVARILTGLTPPATARIVHLPGLPPKGDVVDFMDARDAQAPADLRREIEALADAAPPFDPAAVPELLDGNGEAGSPVLVCMADVKAERLAWLWPGRIPLGKVTLLFGDPGLGKSFVTLDVAARVSSGMAWPDVPHEAATAGRVILLSAEDDLGDTIRPRLDAAGADAGRIVALQGVEYRSENRKGYFNLARDLPALEQAIRRTQDVRLVIIDPISAYLGGADSHNNAEIRGLLAPLADLAARHGAAVVGVTHLNKGMGGRALYRATGSLAFIAAARAGWLVTADADNPQRRLFLSAKSNLAQEPTGLAYTLESVGLPGLGPVGRVRWEPEAVTMMADDALAAGTENGEPAGVLQEAVAWLQGVLADGPVKAVDVKKRAAADGITARTLDRAKAVLKVEATRQGFGGPWVWALPARSTPNSP